MAGREEEGLWKRLEAPATVVAAVVAVVALVAKGVPRVRHFFDHHGVSIDAIWPLALAAFILLLLAWRGRADREAVGAVVQVRRDFEVARAELEASRANDLAAIELAQKLASETASSSVATESRDTVFKEYPRAKIRATLQEAITTLEEHEGILTHWATHQSRFEPSYQGEWPQNRHLLTLESNTYNLAYRQTERAFQAIGRVKKDQFVGDPNQAALRGYALTAIAKAKSELGGALIFMDA